MWGTERKIFSKQGQTIVEISLITMIITSVLVAMTPMIRRSLQGMIKVAADQIGEQENSDQDFENKGFTTDLVTSSNVDSTKETHEQFGEFTYVTDETTETQTEQRMDYGIAEK